MKYLNIIIIILTPAICWCQYFYKTFPEQRTATFLSIKNNESSIFLSSSNFCDLKECGKISEFDLYGNKIWENLLKNNDVGISTLQILKDTIYIGGNYNIGFGKTIISRLDFNGNNIDEFVYSDPLNRISGSLMNQLFVLDDIIYFSGTSYVDGLTRATIYSMDRAMKYKSVIVDSTGFASSTYDAYIGTDSLLTCFIMQSSISVPKDRRRIEKYDKDLNLVLKYQPPDSLLFLGNDIHLYGTVLNNGNIFFSYYKFGWNDRLPNLRCIDTVSKQTKWEYDFPNISSYKRQVLRIKELKNGDILISGQYATLASNPRIRNSPWLMRIDRNGNRKWEKAYVELEPDGQDKTGALWDAIELDNGDIMACGFVINNNKWDPLLIRTDADGCINQGQANCPTVQIIDLISGNVNEIGSPLISIVPNPASTYITIDAPSRSVYTIYNLSGQEMMTGEVDDINVDISHLGTGLYLLRVIDNGGHIYNHKLQKL